MKHTIDKLPPYLRRYCAVQDYGKYTPREHATWRFIMRQNKDYFAEHAVDVYLDGLVKTGIPINRIPNIAEMDEKLSQFGYGAVGVVGFIPPAIFLEFQSLGIMPIATDIRTLEHVGYTPAPDIVHEAAGHVPVVADPDYRAYLSRYGKIANKALISHQDIRRYEAIRILSDIKENPDTKPGEVDKALARLHEATQAVDFVSESTKVSRMGWWTIEYGLVGSGDDLKIYGAGLLSSVSESQNCLSDSVKKIPLTVDCVNTDFDITEQQPQLFVVESLKDLNKSLEELEATFSFVRGGIESLHEAKKCKTVNTVGLDSGLEFCGIVTEYEEFEGRPSFIKVDGPTQFCLNESVISEHTKDVHPHGFSSPIGPLKKYPGISPATFTSDEFRNLGIEENKKCTLEYCSGFKVEGVVRGFYTHERKTLLIRFEDCTVTKSGRTYYEPDWGVFDLALGLEVATVYSGPGDRKAYGEYDIGTASTYPGRLSPFSDEERLVFNLYQKIRDIREDSSLKNEMAPKLQSLASEIFSLKVPPGEWLLYLEMIELAHMESSGKHQDSEWYHLCVRLLNESAQNSVDKDVAAMIRRGLRLAQMS